MSDLPARAEQLLAKRWNAELEVAPVMRELLDLITEQAQQIATLTAMLALGLKVDEWDPPLVNWLETPLEAMRAMTLNMAKSRDELKHANRKLEAQVAALTQDVQCERTEVRAVGKAVEIRADYDAALEQAKERS